MSGRAFVGAAAMTEEDERSFAKFEALATFLGEDSDTQQDVALTLWDIRGQYLDWKERSDPDNRSKKIRLKELKNFKDHLSAVVAPTLCSDNEGDILLYFAQLGSRSGLQDPLLEGWKDATHQLLRAIEKTEQLVKNRPNKRPDGELGWAVSQIVTLFEETTKLRPTHTSGDKGEPRSATGLFVRSFFELVDPKVTPSMISTQLRGWRKRRAVRKKNNAA